jgi:hypothetical protein
MEHLISLCLGVLGRILGTEIEAWAPIVSKRLIDRAIQRLPELERERFREEWFAHLEECPGSLSKLLHALGCVRGAGEIYVFPRIKLNRENSTSAKETGAIILFVKIVQNILSIKPSSEEDAKAELKALKRKLDALELEISSLQHTIGRPPFTYILSRLNSVIYTFVKHR